MHPNATVVSTAVAIAIEWAGMVDWVGECMVLESSQQRVRLTRTTPLGQSTYSLEKPAQR